jgi:hypothetical protein
MITAQHIEWYGIPASSPGAKSSRTRLLRLWPRWNELRKLYEGLERLQPAHSYAR